MSGLKKLITDINKNCSYFERFEALTEALKELDELIGHSKVKSSMTDQVYYIIGCKKNTRKLQLPLLNTVLYGPPGVGKTTVGECLAKIWMALGILDGEKKEEAEPSETAKTQQDEKEQKETGYFVPITIFCSFVVFLILFYVIGGYVGLFIGLFFIFFLLSLSFFWGPTSTVPQEQPKQTTTKKNIKLNKKQDIPITIVRREDLVGQYVGHTAFITSNVLRECLGGVLFIDEAYSLVHGPRDDFGKECLNTINQFLSENKGRIICIFAGYKDKLQNGPFKMQPGLVRRFMWHIECDGYKYDELYQIFKYQCSKKGFGIKNDKETIKLFKEYDGKFPSYGGDTERTLFYSELEYYRGLTAGERDEDYLFEPQDIRIGIERMIDNNLLSETGDNNVENMLSMFETDHSDIIDRVQNRYLQ